MFIFFSIIFISVSFVWFADFIEGAFQGVGQTIN